MRESVKTSSLSPLSNGIEPSTNDDDAPKMTNKIGHIKFCWLVICEKVNQRLLNVVLIGLVSKCEGLRSGSHQTDIVRKNTEKALIQAAIVKKLLKKEDFIS